MGLFNSLSGMVTVEIVSADCSRILDMICQDVSQVFHVVQVDDLTVQLQISRQNYRKLKILVQQRGAKIKIVHKFGIYWTGKGLLARPWLLIGLLILIAVTLYLPTRILFIEVEGNVTIPTKLILERANECGISFGASRREVRSERVKNNLLGAIPELQWVGVNTNGCTAVISVAERTTALEVERGYGVSSVVAARDGVIVSSVITKGNPLCKLGQAVKAGEVLVSGYTDCGISIQATRAQAEIMAQTMRELTAVMPLSYTKRGELTAVKKCYSLIVGKHQIRFGKDGSEETNLASKIKNEYRLTLPGGFVLPITLVVETFQHYEYSEMVLPDQNADELIGRYLRSYVNQTMIGGQITNETSVFSKKDSFGCVLAKYACLEMIGIERSEDTLISADSMP